MADKSPEFDFPVVDMPPSACASPHAAVSYLVGRLADAGHVRPADVPRLAGEVLARESQSSTAVGRGVAVPHAKSEVVGHLVGIIGRCPVPIPWPGAGEEQVRTVCLLVTTGSDPGGSLRALAAIVSQLAKPPGPRADGAAG
jgi:mannitol/fructose-specific phosphotransferase system IIA component (Ntr-type)